MVDRLEQILKDVLCEDDVQGMNLKDIESLDKLDFLFHVEQEFNISLDTKDLAEITTLAELAELCTIQQSK